MRRFIGWLCILSIITLVPVQRSAANSPRARIVPENASRVAELMQLGRGQPLKLAWSPDGHLLAVGSTVGLWLYNAEHLDAEPRYLPEHLHIEQYRYPTSLFFFSADSAYIVAEDDTSIIVWDTGTGKKLSEIPARSLSFYPTLSDPLQIEIGGKFFDLSLSSEYLRPAVANKPQSLITANVRHFARGKFTISSDEQSLLFAPADTNAPIELWNINSGQKVVDLPAAAQYSWSPNGQYIAASQPQQPYLASLWSAADGKRLWEESGTCGIVSWSPDDSKLALNCFEKDKRSAEVVESQTGKIIASGGQLPDERSLIAFSSDNSHLFFYGSRLPDFKAGVVDWDLANGSSATILPDGENINGFLLWLDAQAGGDLVALAGTDSRVRVFNRATHTQQNILRFTPPAFGLVFTPDSQTLISTGFGADNSGASLFAWNTENGHLITDIALDRLMYSIDVSADGQYLLTGGENTGILWNATSFKQVATDSASYPLLFSPLAGRADYPNRSDSFGRWNFGLGSNSPMMMTPTGLVSREAAFSNDEKLLFSAGNIYSVDRQVPIARVNWPRGFFNIAVSPDDQLFAISDKDSAVVSLWNTRTLTAQAEWRVHTEETVIQGEGASTNLVAVAFSPDGHLLAAGGGQTLMLIDVTTKAIVMRLHSQSQIGNLAFSPDGTLLAAGVESGVIEMWGVATP